MKQSRAFFEGNTSNEPDFLKKLQIHVNNISNNLEELDYTERQLDAAILSINMLSPYVDSKELKKRKQLIKALEQIQSSIKESTKLQTMTQMLLLQDLMDNIIKNNYEKSNLGIAPPKSRPKIGSLTVTYFIRKEEQNYVTLINFIRDSTLSEIAHYSPFYKNLTFEINPTELQNTMFGIIEPGNIGLWKKDLIDYIDTRAKGGNYTGFWIGFNRKQKLDAAECLYHALSGRMDVDDFLNSPYLPALQQGKLANVARAAIEHLQEQKANRPNPGF